MSYEERKKAWQKLTPEEQEKELKEALESIPEAKDPKAFLLGLRNPFVEELQDEFHASIRPRPASPAASDQQEG